MTLDGVIEDPAAWAGPYLDDDFQKGALERLVATDAMLMGRRTYELLSRDWANQSGDFANRINGIPKYVFSSTLKSVQWRNATIIENGLLAEVQRLKAQPGADLAVYGHGRLAQTLLRNALLDEVRISVFPVFVGHGQLLFREGESSALRLIEATALPTGVVVLRYCTGAVRARVSGSHD